MDFEILSGAELTIYSIGSLPKLQYPTPEEGNTVFTRPPTQEYRNLK